MANLRRVFGDAVSDREIVGLAQAHYAHLYRSFVELLRFPFLSEEKRAELARVLGDEALRERELREARRLHTEMGATRHAERVSRELDS